MSKNNKQVESNDDQLRAEAGLAPRPGKALGESETTATGTLRFHSLHPRTGNATRASYTIAGVPGNVVIYLNLFKDGVPPPSLELGVPLAEPVVKPDAAAKLLAQQVKAQERADKAAAKVAASVAKAQAAADKAKAAAEAAAVKISAAATVAE